MKKRFSKFCSLLLTFAVTATTVLSSDAMLLTTYADDEVAIVEEVAVEEVAVEAAEEVEEEISIADEVVIEDEVVINDEAPEVTAPDLYIDPAANLVIDADGNYEFNMFVVYSTSYPEDANVASAPGTANVVSDNAATEAEKEAAGINATSCNKLVIRGTGATSAGDVEVTATIDGESKDVYVTLLKSGEPINPPANTKDADFGIVVSFEDVDTKAYGTSPRLVKEKIADAPGRYYFTGQAITPTVVVKDGDDSNNVLEPGKDYSVKYKNNKALATGAIKAAGYTEWDATKGTAEDKAPCMEITLKGAYANKNGKSAVIKKYFDIIPAQINNAANDNVVNAMVELKSDRIASDKKVDPKVTIYSGVKKGVLGAKKTVIKNDGFEIKVVNAWTDITNLDSASWNKLPTLDEFNANKDKATGEYVLVVSANEATPVRLNNSGDKTCGITGAGSITGDPADGQISFFVYNKALDLAKAKVTLSKNSISWNSPEFGAAATDSDYTRIDGNGFIDTVKVGSVELTEADFAEVGLKKVVGKQTELYLLPGVGAQAKGIYDPAVVKANITVTPIADIKDATGIKFTDSSIIKEADAKKLTYVKVYDRSKTEVGDYAAAAGLMGSGAATISVNGFDLGIGDGQPTYNTWKKVNSDPVGEMRFTVVGNPYCGYVGKYDVVFKVVAPANATAADFFYVDEDPNAPTDFTRTKSFTDNSYTIPGDYNSVSFNKKMAPVVQLQFKGGSVLPVKNKFFQVKYTMPKTALTATAEIKFKGALKELAPVTVNFEVHKTSLADCNFSDPSFKATASMNASAAAKKAKLVITDASCGKLKAGKDYIVSSNVYEINMGTPVSLSDNTLIEVNKTYFLAVTAAESECFNLPSVVSSTSTRDGNAVQIGDTIYVPFRFGLTFNKQQIDDQVIYQKYDNRYFTANDGIGNYEFLGEYVIDGVTLKRGVDYDLVECHNPAKETAQKYYGTPGNKKVKLVASRWTDKVSGSITLNFNVKVRETDNGFYKNVLNK